jgi:CheY-like chemotaxis protein/predicted metal-dependent HD superfamily phosphohydrolase
MPDSRGRILVVDDSRINRMMLHKALDQEGYSVATAENGRLALELLNSQPFDVVLLDILMPELDGYETLERIKGSSPLRHIPVIMISAVEEMDSVVRCIEMGATDYLPKPFNPALLRARINASLAEKRLRDLEREYLEQVGYVADAAAAVRAARFDPASLDRVATRGDALGQLARVFQHMAREVHLREQRLKKQLEQMHRDVEEMRRAQLEPLYVYLPMDRRQALLRGESLPDRTTGTALFADISGFTPLTAALAQELGLQRGAEELTRLLNEVFGALVAEVHGWRGSVIGFSGDAVTCWFDGDDGPGAVACALAMQSAMAPFASITTPTGTPITLAIKVAVAAGPVRRFLVGNPELHILEVIAGRTLDQLARAEQHAHAGEVVVTAGLWKQAGGHLLTGDRRLDPVTGEEAVVVLGLAEPASRCPWPELPPDGLPDHLCRPWLAPAVAQRLSSGSKQFLAELRPAVALFLSFGGIDYDGDDGAGAKLDTYVRWAQAVVHHHQGMLLQLTVGDKGSYLYATFGAPVAHEDDEVRAVQAALALQAMPPELDFVTGVQIGLARGRMRTGAYGSTTQRTYGVLGDKTNLAARLMQAAAEGILCDEVVFEGARRVVSFQPLPPIRVKGKDEPLAVYRPTGRESARDPSRAAIRACIDALAPAEQLTLKIASVIGHTFSVATLAAIYPVESEKAQLGEHLAVLVRAGLVEELSAGSELSFHDPAVRRVAYDSLLFAQRRLLHRQIAEWLEVAYADDLAPHCALLAHHWHQADESSRAAEYLEKAGQEALRAGALEEAEGYFRESLELDARSALLSNGFYERTADWAAAREYALARLEVELLPELTYHNLWHSRDDVLSAVQRLAAMAGLGEEQTRLLETAAVFHDLGFTVQRHEHERLSAEIAAQVLPGFGYSAAQIGAIQGMILATQLPQSPQTPLEEILADADLDVLGREDFWQRNECLREELAASGTQLDDERWFASQLQVLSRHHYWTAAARTLRDAGKEKNIAGLRARLASARLPG